MLQELKCNWFSNDSCNTPVLKNPHVEELMLKRTCDRFITHPPFLRHSLKLTILGVCFNHHRSNFSDRLQTPSPSRVEPLGAVGFLPWCAERPLKIGSLWILLMVQKCGQQPVEVGSFFIPCYLQGFFASSQVVFSQDFWTINSISHVGVSVGMIWWLKSLEHHLYVTHTFSCRFQKYVQNYESWYFCRFQLTPKNSTMLRGLYKEPLSSEKIPEFLDPTKSDRFSTAHGSRVFQSHRYGTLPFPVLRVITCYSFPLKHWLFNRDPYSLIVVH